MNKFPVTLVPAREKSKLFAAGYYFESVSLMTSKLTTYRYLLKFENENSYRHGLINIKTPKLNVVFTGVNRVYSLEILSVILVFSTQLCELLPL
jgi:hypothetical protein